MPGPAPPSPSFGRRVYRICFAVAVFLMAASLGMGFLQVASTQGRMPSVSRDVLQGAREALARGQGGRARREFRKAAEVSPGDYGVLLSAAEGLGRGGDLAGGLALVDRAERRRPGLARAATVRGWVLLANGLTADAYSAFAAGLARNPKDAQAVAGVAEWLLAQGRYEDATRFFSRSVQLDPRRAETRDGFGMALALAGRPGEAVDQFSAALTLEPVAYRQANLDRAQAEAAASRAARPR